MSINRTGRLQDWQRQHVERMYAAYGLSPRERDVCNQLLLGKGSGEIAEALYIERQTVRNHITCINRRLGTQTTRSTVLALLGVIVTQPSAERKAA